MPYLKFANYSTHARTEARANETFCFPRENYFDSKQTMNFDIGKCEATNPPKEIAGEIFFQEKFKYSASVVEKERGVYLKTSWENFGKLVKSNMVIMLCLQHYLTQLQSKM